MKPLAIRHIQVKRGALVLEVEAPLSTMRVPADAARRMLELLPNLAHHVCVNDNGDTFGDEIAGTEAAHLLEHTIIELQGKAYASWGANRPLFTGRTSWKRSLAEARSAGESLMLTTVTFVNDFVALQAAEFACGIIEWAYDPDTHTAPDIAALVDCLAQLV